MMDSEAKIRRLKEQIEQLHLRDELQQREIEREGEERRQLEEEKLRLRSGCPLRRNRDKEGRSGNKKASKGRPLVTVMESWKGATIEECLPDLRHKETAYRWLGPLQCSCVLVFLGSTNPGWPYYSPRRERCSQDIPFLGWQDVTLRRLVAGKDTGEPAPLSHRCFSMFYFTHAKALIADLRTARRSRIPTRMFM